MEHAGAGGAGADHFSGKPQIDIRGRHALNVGPEAIDEDEAHPDYLLVRHIDLPERRHLALNLHERPRGPAGLHASYGTTTMACVSSLSRTRMVSGIPVSGLRTCGSRYTPKFPDQFRSPSSSLPNLSSYAAW